jgi:hypothetical protein
MIKTVEKSQSESLRAQFNVQPLLNYLSLHLTQKKIYIAIGSAEVPQRSIKVDERREAAGALDAGREEYFAFCMDNGEEPVKRRGGEEGSVAVGEDSVRVGGGGVGEGEVLDVEKERDEFIEGGE